MAACAATTDVSPGSGRVLQFVPASDKEKREGKKDAARSAASRKIGEAKAEVKRQWDAAKKQLHEPGKMHRLERFAVAQLPYHPQYMDAGTAFNADLRRPLDFGVEPLTPAVSEHIGTAPPAGSVVHAVLITPHSAPRRARKEIRWKRSSPSRSSSPITCFSPREAG